MAEAPKPVEAKKVGTPGQGTGKPVEKERRPAAERFAAQTFTQLRPGIQACAELIKTGEKPPSTLVQAAGTLNTEIAAWLSSFTE